MRAEWVKHLNQSMSRPVLKELADIDARHIVLACSRQILWDVLNQAQQVGQASFSLSLENLLSFPRQGS